MKHHPATHFPGQKWRNTVQSATGLQLALPLLMNINGSFILDFKDRVTEPNIPYSWAIWANGKTISSPGIQLVWLQSQLTGSCHTQVLQQNHRHCSSDHTRVSKNKTTTQNKQEGKKGRHMMLNAQILEVLQKVTSVSSETRLPTLSPQNNWSGAGLTTTSRKVKRTYLSHPI